MYDDTVTPVQARTLLREAGMFDALDTYQQKRRTSRRARLTAYRGEDENRFTLQYDTSADAAQVEGTLPPSYDLDALEDELTAARKKHVSRLLFDGQVVSKGRRPD